jgi:alginate O-acetyltransferase complex protein AlgI
MLSLLPLPITWLGFYGLGRLLERVSLDARRYVLAFVSVALLFVAVGPVTWSFYVSLGLGILLAGQGIHVTQDSNKRGFVFVLSIVAVVLVIFAYLKWRMYFQKYFVYLPSLSDLGFRGIAYLVSRYKRNDLELSAGLMQMFFFPMLFMGPIARVENFESPYQNYYREILERLVRGLSMLIAGSLCGLYVIDDVKASLALHWSWFWFGTLANSFEFYFTFAGYSHLIIGLGMLVGFKLPENFNNPYMASSISDFWRRWHMSLSYWIRDYVYIPLGGNRKGVSRKCLNLLIAMSLVGVWHGLTLNYFLWGLFHGVLMSAEQVVAYFKFNVPILAGFKTPKIIFTFVLVSFSWLLFKYPLPQFLLYLQRMVP